MFTQKNMELYTNLTWLHLCNYQFYFIIRRWLGTDWLTCHEVIFKSEGSFPLAQSSYFLTLIQNNKTEKSTDADKFYYSPAVDTGEGGSGSFHKKKYFSNENIVSGVVQKAAVPFRICLIYWAQHKKNRKWKTIYWVKLTCHVAEQEMHDFF